MGGFLVTMMFAIHPVRGTGLLPAASLDFHVGKFD
jgi:hypothetical protein